MNHWIAECEGVDKAYRFFQLRDITMRLAAGQIMGLVGPNGAGKSTTLRILMGLVRPDRGTVRLVGRDMMRDEAAAKREVGYVSEDMRLYAHATLAWHMQFVAAMDPAWDADYARLLLQRFDLKPQQHVKGLSHGERVKATVLLALARRPRLLVLDEPTTGLDPVGRHELLTELLEVLADERRGIVFSSHNTQDVEQISDQITFIDRGRIIESSDKESFLERWRRIHLDLPSGRPLPALPGVIDTQANGRLAVATTNAYTPALDRALTEAGAIVRDVRRMTLEEIFVATVMKSRKEGVA